MARKLRPAISIISDIGCLGFDLQHYSDHDILVAMTFMRTANPEMFDFLAKVLAHGKAVDAVDPADGVGTT